MAAEKGVLTRNPAVGLKVIAHAGEKGVLSATETQDPLDLCDFG